MTDNIYTLIPKIMNDISPIGKDSKNTGQGYSFRGIDAVYNELHSILAKYGVFTAPEAVSIERSNHTSAKGSVLFYSVVTMKYTFYAPDGSSITTSVVGEGMDSGDKATNKAMAVAHKYALLQVFCIPTDDPKDPEIDSHEVAVSMVKAAGIPVATTKPVAAPKPAGPINTTPGACPVCHAPQNKPHATTCSTLKG